MAAAPFRVVEPVTITDAVLTSSNVPETDYAEYAAGTTYALGTRVIRSATHKIYESAAGSNIGHTPETSPTWWIEVSATNAWKMFDTSNSTQTAKASSISVTLTPGVLCNGLAALNLTGCLSIRVRVVDATYGTLYDVTTDLSPLSAVSGWFEWFFGSRTTRAQFVLPDLPHVQSADILVDFTGTPDLAVGVLLIGQLVSIGQGVKYGAKAGITDYSRKETNTYGDTVLVQRAFARRASFTVAVLASDFDETMALMVALRATPCLWIGLSDYDMTVIFGFYKEFELLFAYPQYNEFALDIEGLT